MIFKSDWANRVAPEVAGETDRAEGDVVEQPATKTMMAAMTAKGDFFIGVILLFCALRLQCVNATAGPTALPAGFVRHRHH